MNKEEFKAHRDHMKLSQVALAGKMGLSRSNIARYEAGAYPVPEVAAKLLTLLAARSRRHRGVKYEAKH